jgi:putative aminopeptidase FrvX
MVKESQYIKDVLKDLLSTPSPSGFSLEIMKKI